MRNYGDIRMPVVIVEKMRVLKKKVLKNEK